MWNKQNFKLIMDKGLTVLRDSSSDALVANHAVIIREFSEKTMQKYERARTQHSFKLLLLKSFLSGLAKVFQRWYLEGEVARFGGGGKARIVFLSHLTNRTQLSDDDDAYYGNLPNQLASRGVPIVTALTNQSGVCSKKFMPAEVSHSRRIWILPRGAAFPDGITTFWQMIKESLRLLKRASENGNHEELDYFQTLAAAQLDHHSFGALNLSQEIRQICRDLEPAVLVITFEGYPWERLVCKLVHDEFPSMIVIGYQHAVITDGPRAINHKFGRGMDPDHLFCAGAYMRQRLIDEGDMHPKDATIIGSPKSVVYNDEGSGERLRPERCILAAPEGVMSETLMLGRVLVDLALRLPDMRCVLRLHPLLSKTQVLQKCSRIRTAPKNFSISSQSLENDITDAGWLIYRGSSVVIAAIANGVRVLNFDATGRNIGDIIAADLKWRVKCASIDELAVQIQKDLGRCNVVAKRNKVELAEAKLFVATYYSPLNTELAIQIISRHCQIN